MGVLLLAAAGIAKVYKVREGGGERKKKTTSWNYDTFLAVFNPSVIGRAGGPDRQPCSLGKREQSA